MEKCNKNNVESFVAYDFEKSREKRKDFYNKPYTAYCKPFNIIGNLYYIGDKKVASHLLDTGEGLIIFDSGYQHTIHLLVQSVWEMGFNPADIKYIIHSHGHFDHFGASNEFRALYGCKTFMSKADVEMLGSTPSSIVMASNPNPYAELPIIDETFVDGDTIALGNTSIKCVLIPGHSPGNAAFFFNVQDGLKIFRVGYFGGAGFNSVSKAYLKAYYLPYSLRDDFKSSIDKVIEEEVDIMLGTHPSQYNFFEKEAKIRNESNSNPFINSAEWKNALNSLKARYQVFLDSDS